MTLSEASGDLIIAPGNGAEPLTVTLSAEAPNPTVEPASVTLKTTRMWGPLTGLFGEEHNDGSSVYLEDIAGLSAGDVPDESVRLSADSTSDQSVVESSAEDSNGGVILDLSVKHSGSPASYSGSLPVVSDAEKPGSVAVKLLVTDFILWPILAAAMGSLLGWLLVVGFAGWRRKKVLRGAISNLIDKTRPRWSEPEPDIPDSEPDERPKSFKEAEEVIEGLLTLSADLRHAMVNDAKYKGYVKGFEKAEKELLTWIEMIDGAERLAATQGKLDEPEYTEHSAAIREDGYELIRTFETLSIHDVKASAELTAQFDRQVKILSVYIRLIDSFTAATQPLPDPLDETPEELYERFGLLANRSETAEGRAINRFVNRIIRLKQVTRTGNLALYAEVSGGGGPGPLHATQPEDMTSDALEIAPPRQPVPDPEKIVRSIKRWDRVQGLFVALLAILGGVILVYAGKTFGTSTDYVTLVLSAAVAQGIPGGLAADWGKLGPTRNYDLEKEEKAPAS